MVIVGTSGYSYADWRGPFYPSGLPQREMLAFYASQFAAVELNYTYYRMPEARSLAAMVERTPEAFEFCVKAFRGMTHEVPTNTDEVAAVFDRFRSALEPLRESHRLGCVLLQFPWAFRPTKDSASYLRRCRELLQPLPAVVEFRHSSWVADRVRPRLAALLTELGLGYCCVDEPPLETLMPPVVIAAAEPGYVRFHGRNTRKWWQHKEASERYDYLYSRPELAEWATKIGHLDRQMAKTYVFFNNCHAGQAATNARTMLELLAEEPSA